MRCNLTFLDPDSSNVETSQSIIPHSEEQGPRLTDLNPRGGDEVEVRWQQRQDGRLLTLIGRVEHVDPDRPKRVRLEGYKNYREVLRTITRHSTSMISNDTQSQVRTLNFAELLIFFIVLLWRRLKFSLKLINS